MRIESQFSVPPRLAAAAGVAGPLLLGAAITVLTVREREFLRTLGWDPLRAPTLDWPSGLSLGPDGSWMVATFVVCGGLLVVFAGGLDGAVAPGSAWGPRLIAAAGVSMALLGFKVDPSLLPTPRTLGGAIHDGAYVALGLTLLPGMLLLAPRFRRDARWRYHAPYTLATVLVAAPAFALKGILVYIFLGSLLGWFLVTALRMIREDTRRDTTD